MSDATVVLTFLGIIAAVACALGFAPLWALHREARGLERFARSMRQMKEDAEASGGNIKTEATAFKDVFKP